ncbi:MAG: hypothetical protein WCO49_02700 [Nostocales cyanobacterium ELA608]|uniref:Uncharacterized protein n=1 Tax=Aphanizomenon flos-aquae WA102 TaxID=1710896 RepID=A0A1B7X278_APHFL|nr:MAG: hypothetical protein AN488_09100 [Anabaena sp. WA113]OBQ43475.1 MAG: hypothetical protein AN484_12080 [Aphanizomenon flos-aquae WA102]
MAKIISSDEKYSTTDNQFSPGFADIQKLKDNLDYEQRRITDVEDSSLKDTLKRLQNEKHELQEKLTEVLSLAIQQGKINKVKHDLQIGVK